MDICEYFVENFQNLSSGTVPWMQKMRTSFSNFNRRLTYGNSFDFGDFDSCIETKINNSTVVGKYCLIKYTSDDVIAVPPYRSPYSHEWTKPEESFGGAICIPNVCSNDIIYSVTNQLFNGTNHKLSSDYNQDKFCQVQTVVPPKASDYLVVLIFLLYLLFLVMCTMKTRRNDEKSNGFLSAFSVRKNLDKLFEVKVSSFNASFQYFSVIQTCLYTGMIFFHSYFLRAYYPLQNSEKMVKFLESPLTTLISVLPHGLLGFFIISSALTAKKCLVLLERKSFNFVSMVIERYARTMFVVLFVMLFSLFFDHLKLYQAPFYFPDQTTNGCKKYWWRTLLLIVNYYDYEEENLCLPHSWFLCVNFHFFVLTPLIIYPIWKWRKSAWVILPALLIGAQVINYFYVVENEIHLQNINFYSISNRNFTNFYSQTHYLASAWIVGMALGVVFHQYKKIKIIRPVKLLLQAFIYYVMVQLLVLNLIFGPPKFNVYLFTFFRLIISLFIGSIMFLCNYMHVDDTLKEMQKSTPVNLLWIIIDRIGLSLYIIQLPIIYNAMLNRKQPISYDAFPIFLDFIGDMISSIVFAMGLYLIIEEPFNQFTKKVLAKIQGKPISSTQAENVPSDDFPLN